MVLWRAKEATIYTADTLSSVSSSTTLLSQITGLVDWSGRFKNLAISGAEADTESVFFFGADDDGRQNAELDELNMTQREMTGTMAFKDEEAAELALSDSISVGATGFNRVQGDTTRVDKALLVHLDDGTNNVHILLNNAKFTKVGDLSLDSEGHMEQEIACKCLAKDYYEESDFS